MTTYIFRRLQFAVLVVFAVTFLSFVLVYLSGDPARALAGVDTTEANLVQIRQEYGLDRPLYEQYGKFLMSAIRGDMGTSFHFHMDVVPLVADKFFITFQLAFVSLIFSTVVALPLGVLSATREGKFIDYFARVVSLLGISTPGFWLGIILILLFADHLRILPASGREDGPQSFILPAITLSSYNIGLLTGLMRRSMLEEFHRQYVTVAHAKGLKRWYVTSYHALRNALIPTVTVAGLQFGAMLGGSIVVETVFAWPGLGSLMLQAIRASDLPIIRAAVLLVGVSFVFINLFVDISYIILDPRVRYK